MAHWNNEYLHRVNKVWKSKNKCYKNVIKILIFTQKYKQYVFK